MDQQDTSEHEITINAIIEKINKSSSSKNTSTHEELEDKLVINEDPLEQSTRAEFQSSLLGEALSNPQPTNTTQMAATTTLSLAQDSNSNEWSVPREEFELIDDPNSIEEITIYDVVVEYQGIITSTTQMEEEVIEIETKPTERETSIITNEDSWQILKPSSDVLESTTMSQILIAHEEEALAQSFGEPSDEEIEEWTKVLNDKADDEQWGRDGVNEEDMELITKDRSNPIPTNNDCISNIYEYEEVDDPAIPTAIFYRYCKPPTSLEEVQRRENFRERRCEYFARSAIKVGHSWFPETYLPDPEDPEWSWKEGLE